MTTASKTDTEAHILTRLGGIREDTPVGTIWQHGKWGHLYKASATRSPKATCHSASSTPGSEAELQCRGNGVRTVS